MQIMKDWIFVAVFWSLLGSKNTDYILHKYKVVGCFVELGAIIAGDQAAGM